MNWNPFSRGIPAPPDSSPAQFDEINTRLDRIFVRFDRLGSDSNQIMEGIQQMATNQQRLDQDIADLRVKVEANAAALIALGAAG